MKLLPTCGSVLLLTLVLYIASVDSAIPIGFSVYSTRSVSYGSGARILFHSANYNYAGKYCITCRWFTCPVSGYYLFKVHLYSGGIRNKGQVCGAIMVNGGKKAEAFSHNSGSSYIYVQASNSVIAYCRSGWRVYVQNRCSKSYVSGVERRSTFSGYKL